MEKHEGIEAFLRWTEENHKWQHKKEEESTITKNQKTTPTVKRGGSKKKTKKDRHTSTSLNLFPLLKDG